MCLGGGGSAKVETPKPPPLPPPLPAPPPPAPPPRRQEAKKLNLEPEAKPDIRIGGKAKAASTGRKDRTTGAGDRAASTLTIGDNQGLRL